MKITNPIVIGISFGAVLAAFAPAASADQVLIVQGIVYQDSNGDLDKCIWKGGPMDLQIQNLTSWDAAVFLNDSCEGTPTVTVPAGSSSTELGASVRVLKNPVSTGSFDSR